MTDAPDTPYRLSIRRPVTVAMLFVTLVVFGWRSYRELPINLMPDMSYPTLTVRTEYEGAAPEDVEKLVTRPIEERLSIVSGVLEVSSVSSAGISEIVLEFAWGTDMNAAIQDVRESLDLFSLPQGVTQKPIILRYDPTLDPVMRVAVIGRDFAEVEDPVERARLVEQDLTEIRLACEEEVKTDLEAEVGIAQVIVKGGQEEEIQILVDSARLKNLGLTVEAVVSALEQENVNLSGGRLLEGDAEYLVRTLNEFQTIDEIRGTLLSNAQGDQFRLDDVASVELAHKERESIVRINGREAVELEFFKEGDANVVQVCDTLKDFFDFNRKVTFQERMLRMQAERGTNIQAQEALAELERRQKRAELLRRRLPEFSTKVLVTDQSRFIAASINEVQQSALIGGLLALVVLFFFLRELRTTLIIGIAIPISVIATFVPMFIGGISLNIMSLGGLALGIGMLVDNSIVVLESIFRCREEGDDVKAAAERGTREVASAVTASTLTTIAVFFPIVFVEGIAGQLFRDLALTVTFSLIASLIVALYLIPMIASREGWHLTSGESPVWLLRGYAQGRQEGDSILRAAMRAPRRGWRAGEAVKDVWNETLGGVVRRIREGSRWQQIGAGLIAPVVFVLFVLMFLLRLVGAIAGTVLMVVTFFVLGALGGLYLLFRFILALPLRVYDRGFNLLRSAYSYSVRQVLHLSPLVLLAAIALGVHAANVSTGLGRELIPPMKQGEFGIRMEAQPGTRLEETDLRAGRIEKVVRQFSDVDTVTVQVGGEATTAGTDEGENVATFTVKLRDPDQTALYQDEIIERIRAAIQTVDSVTFTLPTLFSFKTAMEVHVFGEEDRALSQLADEALRRIEDIPGIKDADTSQKKGYPEVLIALDRELMASQGLEPFNVANRLRTEVQGQVATRFSRGGEKIDIRVRTDQEKLASVADLKGLSVSDSLPPVPLAAVADVKEMEGPAEVRRIDQRRVVVLSANVEGRDLGSVASDIDRQLSVMNWPDGYTYVLGGQNSELESSYGGLLFATALAVFLVYVVMACQFESFTNPFLIMFSVPLAFIGVIYVLAWQNLNVSVVVFIGAIVLAGIVVNSAIVLVDYINQLRARGLSKIDAIVEAGTVRFRPIMMTTMTTVLGLIPMALSTGEGAEIRRPLAITVMAGLVSSTLLTLYVIPVVYRIFGGRDR